MILIASSKGAATRSKVNLDVQKARLKLPSVFSQHNDENGQLGNQQMYLTQEDVVSALLINTVISGFLLVFTGNHVILF